VIGFVAGVFVGCAMAVMLLVAIESWRNP